MPLTINLTRALTSSGSSDRIDAEAGMYPGILAIDSFAAAQARTFNVRTMAAGVYSALSGAELNMANSSLANTQDFLAAVTRELLREGILKGAYSL